MAMPRFRPATVSTLLALALSLSGSAAPSDSIGTPEPYRPVAAAYTLEMGGARLADTYLTPLRYTGWNAALAYERLQAMKFNPRRWLMRLSARVGMASAQNPARNATMWMPSLDLSWGMFHRWRLPAGFTVAAGCSTSIGLGCLYLSRNGNNPVSGKAAWTVDASAMAVWNGSIGRLPVALRYQPTIPLIGAFFSPDYGELYYEIYLGNHSGLAHCAWWGDYFAMDHLLTADLRLGGTSLRLGYRGYLLSTSVNNITSRVTTHSFIIGLSGEWLSLNPRKPFNADAQIISAIY